MNKTTHTLVIESRVEAIADARHWVADCATAASFDESLLFPITLATGEALANIIEHAYQYESGHEIHLTLIFDDEKLTLLIRDFGKKPDMSKYVAPDLDIPSGDGGYGVYLIEEVMDEVDYDTSMAEGTQLSIIKYRSEARS
ncbi:MAG: ATP-binding protein [Chloroflexota bacterium]